MPRCMIFACGHQGRSLFPPAPEAEALRVCSFQLKTAAGEGPTLIRTNMTIWINDFLVGQLYRAELQHFTTSRNECNYVDDSPNLIIIYSDMVA